MEFIKYIHKDLVFVNTKCKIKEEVFQLVGNQALTLGMVTPNFPDKLGEREKVFPTGLDMGDYGVAIPHTDPEFVTEQFISVSTLEEPVVFQSMEEAGKKVKASLVFVLGLNEPHQQLAVLQQLMQVIQDEKLVMDVLKANQSDKILKIFEERFANLKGGE